MSSKSLKAFTTTMIVTGVILLPTALPHAIQDLQDLKTTVDSASAVLAAAPNNASWGFFNPGAPAGTSGTADLVTNITSTILRAKYLLDVDKVRVPAPAPTPTIPGPPGAPPAPPATPATPDTLPPSNVSLDDPYLAYINSVPNLAAALTTLGRGWHKEYNKPVWDSIDALQQSMTSFSTSMLTADLIHGPSILRTIRASSSLEDAKVAWSRLLNIPGNDKPKAKREVVNGRGFRGQKPTPTGRFYTHEELWSRSNGERSRLRDGPVEAVAKTEEISHRRKGRLLAA
ncbi:unnamed protein product [Periconia digitata]|uniref:Uncharacterized protein n=1 Tax=Periconia digitata TaxID=1303443 RepID=A0A9W4XN71_9PLEO|nr:unnamed protein product [Periconia digitata]